MNRNEEKTMNREEPVEEQGVQQGAAVSENGMPLDGGFCRCGQYLRRGIQAGAGIGAGHRRGRRMAQGRGKGSGMGRSGRGKGTGRARMGRGNGFGGVQ